MRILLVRNCSSEEEDKGWPLPEVPLSKHGKLEASILATRLVQMLDQAKSHGGLGKVAIISSDHVRGVRTIEPFAAVRKLEIQQDQRFRSIDLGDYYGKAIADVSNLLGEAEYKKLMSDPVPDKQYFPNGESLDAQSRRVSSAINEITTKYRGDGDHVVISTHGTCIQIILCTICGMPLSKVWTWKIPTAAITVVEWKEKDSRWFIHQVACLPG